jgi:hypothetical protein
MDNERGIRRAEEAGLVVSSCEGGVDVVRPALLASHRSRGDRRRETSVQTVLADKDLLQCVLSFVGGQTGRQSVRALGKVAVVCRTWKQVATCDGLWVGVEEEMVPALWQEEQGGKRVVGRDRLVQHGRMLLAERRVWSEDNWAAGLEMHVEIFDRMDGLQLLSARGPLVCEVEEADSLITLGFPVVPAVTVRGSSFLAANREPDHRRWENIEEYFAVVGLCVRVTVRDQRTGKGGLLWEEGCETARDYEGLTPYWRARLQLPEGSQTITSRVSTMVGGQGNGLQFYTTFFVCPEPDQAGVHEDDMRYRVATGDWVATGDIAGFLEDEFPFYLRMDGTDLAKLATTIRSLC